jgi:hypothetical protein
VINPLIFAEVSIRFARIEELEEALPTQFFERVPLPWEAAFLAGKCFVEYRRRSPLSASRFLHRGTCSRGRLAAAHA